MCPTSLYWGWRRKQVGYVIPLRPAEVYLLLGLHHSESAHAENDSVETHSYGLSICWISVMLDRTVWSRSQPHLLWKQVALSLSVKASQIIQVVNVSMCFLTNLICTLHLSERGLMKKKKNSQHCECWLANKRLHWITVIFYAELLLLLW